MKYENKVKKILPQISNIIKGMGGGVPASFDKIDKLPYVYSKPEFRIAEKGEVGKTDYCYTFFVNLINVNGFYYPAEIFKEVKIIKDEFENLTTYNIYLKDEYSNYASERDNSIVLNNLSADMIKSIALSGKVENLNDKRKIVVALPSYMVMVEGYDKTFIIT